MIVEHIKRGNIVSFTATFLDTDGNIASPSAATLYVSFMRFEERVEDSAEMEEQTDGSWFAEWDSSDATKGKVHWSVRSTGPSSAQDGSFDLDANLANPDPESA